MRKMIKRGLNVVLAVCLMLSILALPGVTVARAEGETASSLISTPVYSHGMEKRNMDATEDPDYVSTGHASKFPLGWDYPSGGQNADGSTIVTDGEGRTYYHMAVAGEKNGITYAYRYDAENYDDTSVLSYSVMVDNSAIQETCTTWTVLLPSFGANSKGHTIGLTITDYTLKYGSGEKLLIPGTWYDITIVRNGTAVGIYLDGEEFATGSASTDLPYLIMGLNGNSATNTAGLSMNIDDLKVYDYVADAAISASKDSYEVKAGETVATGWTKTEGAYLPSITFESSNEKVAKVDENGVITGISAGTATITATPAASSGMAAATTTVTVKDPSSILSEPVYSNLMDVLDSGESNYWSSFLPTGWSFHSQGADGSSIVTDGDRTYYHMETKKDKNGNANAYLQNAGLFDGSCVLSYSFMVNNTVTDSWTVYLPCFGSGIGGYTNGITVTDNTLSFDEEKSLTPGTWYDLDVVLTGEAISVYLDGAHFATRTVATTGLNYLMMGIGGASATNTAGLSMNIDNLAVYDYVAGTGFAAVTDSYEVAVNESVKPVWTKAPANAFLPYVTYTSSDKTVATVDENGVVTGLKDGTVTITATPSKSSGMSAATTTVVVGTGVQEDILKFSNASLVLQDNLAINFKANADLFTNGGYSDPYAVFTFNNKTYTVEEYNIVDGQYVFQFTDIAPHMMGDDITYKLVATSNGEEVSSTSGTYSVLDYCTDALGKTTNGTLKTLLVDTLNYGAAAQTYKNYNTGNLVNAGLTDDQKALATADRELVKIENLQTGEGGLSAQWTYAALLLDDAITVKLTFTAASKEGLTVKISDAEQEIVDSGTEGTYYVYYPLTPKQLSDTITAQVFNGETVVSKTLSFSAETYAATKAAGGDALADLVTAMMKYGDAAKAYVPAE